jgi:hypothetical protein
MLSVNSDDPWCQNFRKREGQIFRNRQRISELHHGRGRDELVHRALNDFRAEQLPFKRFQANAAFYYTVLAAKIVRTLGRIVLKVTAAIWDRLQVEELWARSGDPPRFAWA